MRERVFELSAAREEICHMAARWGSFLFRDLVPNSGASSTSPTSNFRVFGHAARLFNGV